MILAPGVRYSGFDFMREVWIFSKYFSKNFLALGGRDDFIFCFLNFLIQDALAF